MRRSLTARGLLEICGILILGGLIVLRTVPVLADQIQATVGAQSGDKGRQALAFLPNELWVHAGDSVTWAFPTTSLIPLRSSVRHSGRRSQSDVRRDHRPERRRAGAAFLPPHASTPESC